MIIFHLDDSKNLRGGERQALYLAEELKKLGHENIIVCRKNFPLEKEAGKRGLKTMTLPYIFEWDIISALILSAKIRKEKQEVIVHSHTGHMPAIAFLAKLFCNFINICHRRVDFPIKNNIISKTKYKNCDAIISISLAIAEILKASDIEADKISIIPSSFRKSKNFIPDKNLKASILNRLETKNTASPILIGSLMAFVPHKDPLNLIKAAQICINKFTDCFFVIAGEGPLKKDCELFLKKNNLSGRILLLPYIQDNLSFMSAIDIFTLSSKEEGLGSSLIEAMNFSLPLAGTDAGGIKELIKDGYNGFLVQKENPEALAEALLKIATNENLRKQLSVNSLKMSEKFSPEIMAKETLKIYEKTIKNS